MFANELVALLEYFCDPAPASARPTQLVTGLETPGSMKANGYEEEGFWMNRPLFRNMRVYN